MATLTWLKAGLSRKLGLITNKAGAVENLKLGLYVNNHAPDPNDTTANYTECTLAGYAQITLTGANWSTPSYSAPTESTVYSPDNTFTFTAGSVTIYGALLFNQAGDVIAAGLLDTAFAVPSGGGTVTIKTLTLTDQNA